MDISKRIVLARKKKGLTQEQLADLANVTVRTIQRIESGESIPRAFTVKTLAEALGTNFEHLTREEPVNNSSNHPAIPVSAFDPDYEKHFLKMLCLSCFAYLVIPLVHFLIPVYLLKKSNCSNPATIAFGREIIKQQIYWVIILCFSMILTLACNFIIVVYFKELPFLHYLWPFFIMYILNAFIIIKSLRRINAIHFNTISIT